MNKTQFYYIKLTCLRNDNTPYDFEYMRNEPNYNFNYWEVTE